MSLLKSLTFDKIPICLDDITKLSFQAGTICSVKSVAKARKPSYEMEACFDEGKKSCGQFTRNYKEEELIGKQIIGLTNLPFVRIAGIKSEYLTLGFADEMNDGQAIPLTPCLPVKNGARILLPDSRGELNFDKTRQAEYKNFESVEILSATVVDIVISQQSGKNFCIVDFGKQKTGVALAIGKLKGDLSDYLGIQIPVICNLDYEQEGCILTNETKLVAFSLPVDSNHSTLVKVDKPII
ncbi:tRNA-binding [Brachionus plicatilis]|uniref:tRNA-binding n=1 Tax=Brachionus plicatilis TaxID=10195 RepID=A0A3M7S7G7_BRAPC|nr:tRNA-binding [Brachionus plicatilis]